jgi:nicotinamidase-related amidase
MDVQRGKVERFGGAPDMIDRLARTIAAARTAGVPIIYVVVRFRPGSPEVSARNKSFAALKTAGTTMDETQAATRVHPAVAPQPGGIMVAKRPVSAFAGSDLAVVLRSLEIDLL